MKFERSNDVEWKSEVQVQTVTDDDPNACLTAHAIIQLVQYDNWLRPVFAVIWEVNHRRAGEILGHQTRKHLGDFDSFFEAAERADYVYLRRLTKQYLDLALPEETRKAYKVRSENWMVDFEQSKAGQPDTTPFNENIG